MTPGELLVDHSPQLHLGSSGYQRGQLLGSHERLDGEAAVVQRLPGGEHVEVESSSSAKTSGGAVIVASNTVGRPGSWPDVAMAPL
jgi:hypothetical protein